MNLKQYRLSLGITMKQVSSVTEVPLRTYVRYENDDNYGNKIVRESIYRILKDKYEITEEKGLLTIQEIVKLTKPIFEKHKSDISFCYLFGSYAKGYATDTSDIDLCVKTTLEGLNFVGLSEEFREVLHKKIDLVNIAYQSGNIDFVAEIMKDGLKIYG